MNTNKNLFSQNPEQLNRISSFAPLQTYSVTPGHFVNCGFGSDANAELVDFHHPRFGLVAAVRAIRDIKRGEEVLVDYGYEEGEEGREWYFEAKKEYQDRAKGKEEL